MPNPRSVGASVPIVARFGHRRCVRSVRHNAFFASREDLV
jgi:hypothetical protein